MVHFRRLRFVYVHLGIVVRHVGITIRKSNKRMNRLSFNKKINEMKLIQQIIGNGKQRKKSVNRE